MILTWFLLTSIWVLSCVLERVVLRFCYVKLRFLLFVKVLTLRHGEYCIMCEDEFIGILMSLRLERRGNKICNGNGIEIEDLANSAA